MLRKGLLVLLLLLVTMSAIQAQEVGSLIILANHQLWVLQAGTDQPQPLDFCMTPEREPIQGNLALSPDGTKLVFRAQPEIVTAAIERSGGIGGGELPHDIWLCDLQTRELRRVASQPEDAALFAGDGTPDNFIVHGAPGWSPDGTKLAWTQYVDFDDPLQLVTYDLASGESAVIAELPPQYGIPTTVEVPWGESGIAFVSLEPTEWGTPAWSIIVYDASGSIVRELTFPREYGEAAGEGIRSVLWARAGVTGNLEVLTMEFFDGHFGDFHVETGISQNFDSLELATLTAGADALSLMLAPFQTENSWAVRSGDSYTELPLRGVNQRDRLAISPDGAAVAYAELGQDNYTIYLWDGTNATEIAMPEPIARWGTVNLVWTPLGGWTHRGDIPDLGISGDAVTCPGFVASRLVVGQRGVVSDDLPNRLRAEPNTSGSLVGQIPSGGEFEVLAGPTCAENLAWWQVDYAGQIGWTAEGQDGDYWLSPLP